MERVSDEWLNRAISQAEYDGDKENVASALRELQRLREVVAAVGVDLDPKSMVAGCWHFVQLRVQTYDKLREAAIAVARAARKGEGEVGNG